MPIQNGKYVNPGWVDGQEPAIDAEELNAMSDTIASTEQQATTTAQGLANFISGTYNPFVQNVYTKDQVYTKSEINTELSSMGQIERVFESSTAGATTFSLPADTLMWWGLAVGGGGGGSISYRSQYDDGGTGGVGGCGGKVVLYGPALPSVVSNNSIVIGEGGKGGKKDGNSSSDGLNGGTTSIFGIIFAEGGPGGNISNGSQSNAFANAYNYYDNQYLFKNFAASSGLGSGGNGEDGINIIIGGYRYIIASAGGRGGESAGGTSTSGSGSVNPGYDSGSATIGKGGNGGTGYDYDQSTHGEPGFDAQNGGGGGGGAGSGSNSSSGIVMGGNGGSGYAAIFIIRKGGQ